MFNSPEQALRFAFKIRDRSVLSKAHNVFMFKEKIRNPNRLLLTAYDLHAQGALIIGFVEKLGRPETAWMYWQYGDPQERERAAVYLADTYEWQGIGLERADIRTVMKSVSARRCAKDMNVSKNKAWRLRRKILDALYPVERRVLDGLWERIEEK